MKNDIKIRLIVLDIDGVLTDGKVMIDSCNNEYKSLNYRDMDGINLLKREGMNFFLLTGEDTVMADIIAGRLGIPDIVKGAKDKDEALNRIAESTKIPLKNICYIGDSDRDAPALMKSGLSMVPQDATRKAKDSAMVILKSKGGEGAVHEGIDYLMKNQYLDWRR